MIGWLQGEKIKTYVQGTRIGLLINCSGVGYETQVLQRDLKEFDSSLDITLWIHQVIKDEGYSLFGFFSKSDRDLFRILISISGIGPQIGISLLEGNNADSLIAAILNKEIATLTESQGVGKRTAERIILELQNKLSKDPNIESQATGFSSTEISNELKTTLRNLEYKDHEINSVLKRISELNHENVNSYEKRIQNNFESLLKEALILLSQKSG